MTICSAYQRVKELRYSTAENMLGRRLDIASPDLQNTKHFSWTKHRIHRICLWWYDNPGYWSPEALHYDAERWDKRKMVYSEESENKLNEVHCITREGRETRQRVTSLNNNLRSCGPLLILKSTALFLELYTSRGEVCEQKNEEKRGEKKGMNISEF